MRRKLLAFLLAAGSCAFAADLKLPNNAKDVRFAFIGDSGTGDRPQYELADQMVQFHMSFPFDFVIMLGDNLYGGETPADFKKKFENPYKALLDGGVKFYASLGNHDDPNQRFYKLFNMDGKRYYSFRKGDVEFFALDSTYMDPTQLDWINKQLAASTADWKICFFHHPLYSHGRMHGSDIDLRNQLEPMFKKYGVSAVFSGHDHTYERLKPQSGIQYFVLGSSGQLRKGNLAPSPDTAKGYDEDRTFGLAEVAQDQMYFQVVSRSGETIDSGTIPRGVPSVPRAASAQHQTSGN